MFRVAIVHGQLTAHGAAVPEVLCLASAVRIPSGAPYREPDSTVVARVRDKIPDVRPISACRIEPLGSETGGRHASLVVERATGRRGIVVWTDAPARDSTGALTVHIGYYEHGLSGADWICAVRRVDNEWIVNACRMIGIS